MSEIEYPGVPRLPEDREAELTLLRKTLIIKRATLSLVILLVVLVVAGGIFYAVRVDTIVSAIRETQQSNTGITANTNNLVKFVKDCTDPHGKCSQKNRKETAETLKSVDGQNRKVSAAGAACAIGVPETWAYHHRYVAIHRCIQRTLGQ